MSVKICDDSSFEFEYKSSVYLTQDKKLDALVLELEGIDILDGQSRIEQIYLTKENCQKLINALNYQLFIWDGLAGI